MSRAEEYENIVKKIMHENLDGPLERDMQGTQRILDLQEEYIDVIREQYGFNGDDDTLKFTGDWKDRWKDFFREHIIKVDGKESCFYQDKDGKYRLIPDEHMNFKEFKFLLENRPNFIIEPEVEIDCLPSFNLLGQKIELSDDYLKYLSPDQKLHEDPLFLEHQILISFIAMTEYLKSNESIKDDKLYKLFKEILI